MTPMILPIDSSAPDPAAIEQVVDALLDGRMIAIPTDTVYGLAADASNHAAVERLYAIKDRSRDKAIPLLIAERAALRHISPLRDDDVYALLAAYWPGALTAVVPRFSGSLTAVSKSETLGVRIPDHPVTLAILRALRRPLAVTSANRSGQPPATDPGALARDMPEIPMLVDAGPTSQPVPSTVVDFSVRPWRVLREGALAEATLRGEFPQGFLEP